MVKRKTTQACTMFFFFLCVLSASVVNASYKVEEIMTDRPRIRELGISPGILKPGELNAITDVDGVRVGHITLIEGDDIRTGVTAILPHKGNVYQNKVHAAVYVGNGFGKAAGFLQVQELGNIETPIVLTNTLNVGTAVEATVKWTLEQVGNERVRSANAVVGETNDGYLNDIRGQHVTSQNIIEAIEIAKNSPAKHPVEEGSIGAGTGTICFGWKGGIGTSSRTLPDDLGGYTIGVLVQSNFGGVLTIDGKRVGEALGKYPYKESIENQGESTGDTSTDGSCMIVIATDAPLTARNLERLAKRAVLGLARTGSYMSNGSGDFVIAFSTQNLITNNTDSKTDQVEELRNDAISPLFLATVEATEEAVYNSLTKATIVTGGDGHTIEAIPIERLKEILK